MKTNWYLNLSWLFLTLFTTLLLSAQKPTNIQAGYPGENFNLEGALDLFKNSNSLEEFEKKLNSENNDVNNLDLNEDGETDYIRVVSHKDGNAQVIILQAMVSENESQDAAVIEIEKTGNEEAVVQIIGDEDIFGKQIIVEAYDDNSNREKVAVNVWFWPSVRFIYNPSYVVWVSPWGFYNRPIWWKPWRPHPLHVFHARVLPYRQHYHVVSVHRVTHAHKVYTPKRTTSTVVHTRTTTKISAQGPQGKKVEASRSTSKTTARNDKGRIEHSKSKTDVKTKGGKEIRTKERTTKVTRKKGG
jgi:hypothetical protein